MSHRGILLSLPIVCLMLPVATSVPATYYVDGSVSASGNGETWETAFKTIQEGIEAAEEADAVIVARGEYFENVKFKGRNITLRSTDPTSSSVVAATVINGGRLGSVVSFWGGEGETCELAGFTIREGRARRGGGIFGGKGEGTRATIRNNTVTENLADEEGGGLYRCHGVVEGNWITGNLAQGEGGGLSDCDGLIRNNIISDNTAERNGGGLAYCDGAIEDNSVWNNRATGSIQVQEFDGEGGGLFICQGLIKGNLISGNSARVEGGGLERCDGTVERNTITANAAGAGGYGPSAGGGVSGCAGTIRANVITSNSAAYGGGLTYVCQFSGSFGDSWGEVSSRSFYFWRMSG